MYINFSPDLQLSLTCEEPCTAVAMLLAPGVSKHKGLDTTYSYSSDCSTDAALSMQAWKYWPVYPYVNLSAYIYFYQELN